MYTPAEAIEAMMARIKGEWDNPQLNKIGSLSPDENDDIKFILELCVNSEKRFTVLVENGGEVDYHRSNLPNIVAVKKWASKTFTGRIEVVDMAHYGNREFLPSGMAEFIYAYGTVDGKAIPKMHVITLEKLKPANYLQLVSLHFQQNHVMKYNTLPDVENPELVAAIGVLREKGYNIIGYSPGDGDIPSAIITDTFLPLWDE